MMKLLDNNNVRNKVDAYADADTDDADANTTMLRASLSLSLSLSLSFSLYDDATTVVWWMGVCVRQIVLPLEKFKDQRNRDAGLNDRQKIRYGNELIIYLF